MSSLPKGEDIPSSHSSASADDDNNDNNNDNDNDIMQLLVHNNNNNNYYQSSELKKNDRTITPIIPIGLEHKKDFLSEEESKKLIDLISDNEWSFEGFEERRRVQRYTFTEERGIDHVDDVADDINVGTTTGTGTGASTSTSNCSKTALLSLLEDLIDRLIEKDENRNEKQTSKLRPNEIVIEERTVMPSVSKSWFFDSHKVHQENIKKENDHDGAHDENNGVKFGSNTQVKKRPTASTFESDLQSKDRMCSHCNKNNNSNNTENENECSNDTSTNGNNNDKTTRKRNKCSCYVAQISLLSPCVQSMNKPKDRSVECWKLQSPNHSIDFIMYPNDLIVKKDECLWNWRSRLILDASYYYHNGNNDNDDGATYVTDTDGEDQINMKNQNEVRKNITIKFRCIQSEKRINNNGVTKLDNGNESSSSRSNSNSTVLSSSSMNDGEGKDSELLSKSTSPSASPSLPLHELLTIIVTTSPIKSNPSTELLESTFDTFIYAGFDFCFNCPKVIICDGCRIKSDDCSEKASAASASTSISTSTANTPTSASHSTNNTTQHKNRPKVTKKHANVKQRLRSGIATSNEAKNYELFKERLEKLCEDAGSGILELDDEDDELDISSFSPFRNTRVIQLEERHGYGFALRHALRHEVATPYVCVIQHDRTFMRQTPIPKVVESMTKSKGSIKYVGMNMRSNLIYRDIFTSKYGSGALNELLDMVITPPELVLDSTIYGPKGVSVNDMVITKSNNKKLEKNITSLAQTYRGTIQGTSHSNPKEIELKGQHQLSLTPTLFWYDNTHICETSHYRDFVFNPTYKMVARGGFVEDKLSPVITRSVERLGLREGHLKFGCYLLDDHSGFFFTGHLDGGSFMTKEEKRRLIARRS